MEEVPTVLFLKIHGDFLATTWPARGAEDSESRTMPASGELASQWIERSFPKQEALEGFLETTSRILPLPQQLPRSHMGKGLS